MGPRLPLIRSKIQLHGSRFVLTKKFDTLGVHLFCPFIRNPFRRRKISRCCYDQSRLHGAQKRIKSGTAGVVLTFDENVAMKISL